jgi:hypothetical protein
MSAAYDPENHFIDILLIATGPEPLAVPIGVDRALRLRQHRTSRDSGAEAYNT